MTQPLILTALLDPESQARFNRERQLHFPEDRNFLAAHVTLFHALPGQEQPTIARHLALMGSVHPPAAFATTGLRFLGRGVAYSLDMPAISALRAELAAAFASWLTPQDRQPFRPHITIQNKAPAAAAIALYSSLAAAHRPWQGEVSALALWRYENGPWSGIATYRFQG